MMIAGCGTKAPQLGKVPLKKVIAMTRPVDVLVC